MGDTPLMPRATVVVRPGWNEAAHTDAEILHAAAYYEFKTHMGRPAPAGPGVSSHQVMVFSVSDRPFPPLSHWFGGGGTSPFQTVTLYGGKL